MIKSHIVRACLLWFSLIIIFSFFFLFKFLVIKTDVYMMKHEESNDHFEDFKRPYQGELGLLKSHI